MDIKNSYFYDIHYVYDIQYIGYSDRAVHFGVLFLLNCFFDKNVKIIVI